MGNTLLKCTPDGVLLKADGYHIQVKRNTGFVPVDFDVYAYPMEEKG